MACKINLKTHIMANKKVFEELQIIVTDLAQQAGGHRIRSRSFASEGFSKLAEKCAEYAAEERSLSLSNVYASRIGSCSSCD